MYNDNDTVFDVLRVVHAIGCVHFKVTDNVALHHSEAYQLH